MIIRRVGTAHNCKLTFFRFSKSESSLTLWTVEDWSFQDQSSKTRGAHLTPKQQTHTKKI